MMKKYLFTILVIMAIPAAAYTYTQEECITCHREESKESVLQISIKEYENSVHGQAIGCSDCHNGVKNKKHQEVKGSGSVNCNQCHSQENRHGINGKQEERPQCSSCHGIHNILGKHDKASGIHPDQLAKTCESCHPAEAGNPDYISWFSSVRIKSHKKQDFSRNYRKDNCIGCHQGMAIHGETEPVTKEDCYICHMQMKGNPVTGYFHAGPGSSNIVISSAVIFHIVIVVLVLGIIFFIIKSSLRKSKERRG